MRTANGVRDHLIWIASVLAFTLAAATGALFRFGTAYGFSGGLDFTHIRHAHSHLMYFAWVTPALFLFIIRRVEAMTDRKAATVAVRSTIAALILGFATYVPFLAFGYSTVTIGPVSLPPSVIIAGLNMIAWYGFVVGYLRQTRGVARTGALALFDGALFFLVLASLGAWAISLTGPLGFKSPVASSAFTHVFLGYFTEGWLLLAVLGLATSFMASSPGKGWLFMAAAWVLVTGIALSFVLGMPQGMVSNTTRLVARAAGGFMAVGLSVFAVMILLKCKRFWRLPGLFLALKAVGFFLVLFTPAIWWADFLFERILYFHIHLLGFVSLGIMAAARQGIAIDSSRQINWMNGAVAAVIVSLLPLTMFWPIGLRGGGAFYAMAWIALLPVGAGLWMILFQRPVLIDPAQLAS